MADLVFSFGLSGRVDPATRSDLAARVVAARAEVRAALARAGAARLVEPFDPNRFNRDSTVGENLLFGVTRRSGSDLVALETAAHLRRVIDDTGLSGPFFEKGRAIARTMVDIFSGMSHGREMFERFSFIGTAELPRYAAMVQAPTAELGAADVDALVALTLGYSELRHRLGLVDADLEARIVRARTAFAETLPPALEGQIDFYHPDRYCAAAPLRDNLLFGRISHAAARADALVTATLREVLTRLGLEDAVYAIGLDTEVGFEGHTLMQIHRSGVDIARCLVKGPDIFVLHDALNGFSEREARAVVEKIAAAMKGRSLVATRHDGAPLDVFEAIFTFEAGRVVASQAQPGPLASVAE